MVASEQTGNGHAGPPEHWIRDPVVWLLVVCGMAASAYVFFSGRYLPYDDWAGHVGLSAVLANGDETGAATYLSRSLVPSPYYLFYVTSALWSLIVPVEVGAKLNLVLSSGLLVIGSARLAQVTGRSPRMAGLAPLALFGISLGMGFSSYLFALPWLLFVLADYESLLHQLSTGAVTRRTLAYLGAGLGLAFLGHGLVFVFAIALIGIRTLIFIGPNPRARAKVIIYAGLAALPVTIIALPSVIRRLNKPYVSPEFHRAVQERLATFEGPAKNLSRLPRALYDRGGAGHETTVLLTLGVLALWVLVAWHRRAAHPRAPRGLLIYLGVSVALFLLGPVNILWPVTFWIVADRIGCFALLLAFIALPMRRLGAGAALCALIPLAHNAHVNARTVERFSAWAAPFDKVRAAIPPKQRVLPLDAGPRLQGYARASSSLGFYLLADGARYVPVGHVPEEVPVHRRDVPDTPPTYKASAFDPEAAAAHYDYVVVRGASLRRDTLSSEAFEEVLRVEGWLVAKARRGDPP